MATEVIAPMLGKVLNFLVEVGDAIEEDEPVLMLEALKMEIPVASPVDGTVEQFCVEQGQSVESGTILVIIQE
jgi:biotin carboxyl carrier protein